jgi:hypothetical protein
MLLPGYFVQDDVIPTISQATQEAAPLSGWLSRELPVHATFVTAKAIRTMVKAILA